MADIFFDGKIYPNIVDDWQIHIERDLRTLLSYTVVGTHNWCNGKDVAGLYEVKYRWLKVKGWFDISKEIYNNLSDQQRRIVALPLPEPTVKSDVEEKKEGRVLEDSEEEKLFKPYCIDFFSKDSEEVRKDKISFALDKKDEAFELFKQMYHMDYGSINIDDNLVSIHSGGWSDNEYLISVFNKTEWWRQNFILRVTGGHYYFDTNKRKGEKEWDVVKKLNPPKSSIGENNPQNFELKEAKELVEKFMQPCTHYMWEGNSKVGEIDKVNTLKAAKQCAIICVEEIIKYSGTENNNDPIYWHMVKEKIQKM